MSCPVLCPVLGLEKLMILYLAIHIISGLCALVVRSAITRDSLHLLLFSSLGASSNHDLGGRTLSGPIEGLL